MTTSPLLRSVGAYMAGSTNTTFSMPAPAGVLADDIVVLHIYQDVTLGTKTVTVPSGFAAIAASVATTGSKAFIHYQYWKRSTGSESAYIITTSGSTWLEGLATSWSGCIRTGSPIDNTNAAARSTNATATPAVSFTPTQDTTLLVFTAGNYDYGTWTPPAGFTERYDGALAGAFTVDSLAQTALTPTGSVSATCATSSFETGWLIGLAPQEEPGRFMMAAAA